MKLFEPFTIKEIKLKNRIVMPGMDTNFGDEEGNIYDKLLDYYELRARGGVGLIIVEGAYFDQIGAGTANMLSISSNKRTLPCEPEEPASIHWPPYDMNNITIIKFDEWETFVLNQESKKCVGSLNLPSVYFIVTNNGPV